MNSISRAVTSITGLIDYNITRVRPWVVSAWQGIGLLTYSHRKLYWDTRSLEGEPTLLEQFGFVKSSERRTDQHPDGSDFFGRGFIWYPDRMGVRMGIESVTRPLGSQLGLERSTYFELRRAYILISHPGEGTLLIKNSSPHFGRSTFEDTAYWTAASIGEGFRISDLENITPQIVKRKMRSVLSPVVNRQTEQEKGNIYNLVQRCFGVLDTYHRSKFDTLHQAAWTDDKVPQLVGGPYSPLFEKLVMYVEHAYYLSQQQLLRTRNKGEMPALCLVKPELPSWMTIPYQGGQSKLTIDQENLAQLKRFAKKGNPDDLGHECWNFFQCALSTQADLILTKE
jgi:hypothetical protein